MYSVPTKMKPKKLPPSRSPTAFAAATDGIRKIRSGISGDSTRVSTTRNAASSRAEPASRATVRVVDQPICGAFEIAYTSISSAPVTVTAPNASKRRRAPTSRLSGTIRRASSNAATPIGTLRKKMYCQPTYRVTRPPVIRPTVAPAAPMPPQIPSALLRSAPSANRFITIDSAAGSATAEQEEAPERQAVRGDDPLETRLGEVQVATDRRECDVDDREVDDRHEE